MTLTVEQIGHPALRQTARALSREEILSDSIQGLIKAMKDTMREAPGVGLAAPQIGQSLQIAVIEDREEYTSGVPAAALAEHERWPVPFHVIINPKITLDQTETVEFFEGCLSIGDTIGLVNRARCVTVECLNERAEPTKIVARGWYARILQHEIDHLFGILCLDHTKLRSFMTIDNYIAHWKNKTIEQICAGLGL